MEFMMEETFGPTVGIMKVKNEEEAKTLMNDSPYGLTASPIPFASNIVCDISNTIFFKSTLFKSLISLVFFIKTG